MARKGQVSIQDHIETNEDFENYLQNNFDRLICMEVFSEFCGHCLATGNAVRKGKLEIGGDDIAMAKAQSDHIDALQRFRYKSEPCFLFIRSGKLTRAIFGANGIELVRVVETELGYMKEEKATGIERPKYDIAELLPEETAKIEADNKNEQEYMENAERLRVLTLAARKKRVSERAARDLQRYNYIMFWPHCHQAHYDLYEKWDNININVAGKETFQLDENSVKEALYMSDVDPNEACLHALFSGPVLVVLFKMFDTDDRDFVKLMRHALYEEIPVPKEDVPPEKQVPPVPAFERYASISKTAREVRRERHEAKLKKLREEQEERDRLKREQERLAREAEEERIRAEKQKADEARMARLAAGLPAEPEPEEVPPEEAATGEETEKGDTEATEATEGTTVTEVPTEVTVATTEVTDVTEGGEPGAAGEGEGQPEEKVEEEEEFHSDVEVEGEEYIPPGGLFIPGLYTPPNDLAKANGLKFFYPKVVAGITKIESEVLPPHVLVMFNVDKRNDVKEILGQFPEEILAMGFFVGEDPYSAEHVAYTFKQYEKIIRPKRYKDRLALMVSRKRSLPLLQLAGFNPCYISSDSAAGEKDCLALFPVGYGDDYVEEESVKEEEIVEVAPVEVEPEPTAPEEVKEEEDEDEEEDI